MTLRQLIHPRVRRCRATVVPRSVEELRVVIDRLTVERQQLRLDSAPPAELERNRRAIANAQRELSRAFIERYRPHAA